MNLLARSRRRRRKQLRRITMIACCISIFLCGSMLYQGHMKPYQRQADLKNYGHWILRQKLPEGQEGLSHPYLEQSGEMTTAVHIYGKAEKREEEAEDTGYYLGTISEDAEEMGNLRLYEGRMPQAEDEIVMELGILNRLGYSYELGQQVTVSCGKYMDVSTLVLEDRKQEFVTNTYTLVGTLENYTDKWESGDVLPNAVVSQSAFQKLDCESTRYVFYSLQEEYQDINALEFVKPIMKGKGIEKPVGSSDDTLVYNDYVYEHHIWGSAAQSRNITLCLMVMGSCAMIYLISSYQKKRRGHYYQLRCIGATKWQVRKFSVLEMLMTVLPVSLFSIFLSYMLCFGITEYIARQNQYASFFEFRLGLFIRIIAAIFLTFLIALLISLLLLGNSRISIQKQTIGKLAKKHLRRQAAKGKLLHARRIARRKDRLHFLQNLCIRMVGIAICTVVLYSLSHITQMQMLYKWQCAVLQDADLRTNNRTMRNFKYVASDVWDMSKSFPQHLEKDLETLIGIQDISYSTCDGTHDFDWEGKEISADEIDDEIYYGAIYYANPDSVWQDFEKQIRWEGADYQKFATGEQVLLCASPFKDADYHRSEDTDLVYDKSLKPGMKLRIPTKTGEVETVLAGIVDRSRILGGWNYERNGITDCEFLCAESLGKQIAKGDGISWGYTHASITFNRLSDAEATGKQLSVLAVENGLTMDSDFETLQKTYRETLRTIILYGSFCIMLLSIYLLLRTCMLRDLFLKEQEEYQKLHRVGMSRAVLLKMSLWRGIREGASYLLALPIALGLVLYKLWQELLQDSGTIAFISFRLEREYPFTNQWNYMKYKLFDEIDIAYWLLFMGCMIMIIAVLYRLHMKWILNEEERRHE